MRFVGFDKGQPDGDYSALSVICPSCRRLWSLTIDIPLVVIPLALECPCGAHTDFETDYVSDKA